MRNFSTAIGESLKNASRSEVLQVYLSPLTVLMTGLGLYIGIRSESSKDVEKVEKHLEASRRLESDAWKPARKLQIDAWKPF
jgi:hypothetical protein